MQGVFAEPMGYAKCDPIEYYISGVALERFQIQGSYTSVYVCLMEREVGDLGNWHTYTYPV